MNDLPAGWATAAVSEIAEVQGGIQKQPKRKPADNAFPFLRVANVPRGGLELSDVHLIELFDGELDRYRLDAGDLLVVEGNGSPSEIGRAAVWDGSIADCVHQNHLIRVRPRPGINPTFLVHAWNAPQVVEHLMEVSSSTSGLHTLSCAKVNAVRMPIPPASEQERIVAEVERRLSRLEAAKRSLHAARRKLSVTQQAILTRAVQGRLFRESWPGREPSTDEHPFALPPSWKWVRLRDVLREPMRNGRSAPTAPEGKGIRTFTITAVTRRCFSIDNTKWAEGSPDQVSDLFVRDGDIFVQRSNTPELVGSAALYRGPDGIAIFPDLLIRVRVALDVLPEYLEVVLRAEPTRQYLRSVASGLAGSMPKIDQSKLGATWIPLPPPDEQKRVATEVDRRLSLLAATERAVEVNLARCETLRRAILRDAFAGRLVRQDPNDEPADQLLANIRTGPPACPARRRRSSTPMPEA